MSNLEDAIRTFGQEEKTLEKEGVPPKEYEPPTEEVQEAEQQAAMLTRAGVLLDKLEELPDLNHKQRRIAYWLALGSSSAETAWRCGVTQAYIRAMRNDPRIESMVDFFRTNRIAEFIEELSPEEILSRASMVAAERLAELMFIADSDNVRLNAAKEILKLGGHGQQTSEKITVVLGDSFLKLYTQTKDEIKEAEFEVEDD